MVKTTPRLPLPLLALSAYALALLVLGAAAPGFAGFFPLLSLWAGLALFYAAVQGLKIAHVELDRFHWAVLGVLWLCAAIYLLFTLSRRDFIYYWDYSNYIFRQYKAEGAFFKVPALVFASFLIPLQRITQVLFHCFPNFLSADPTHRRCLYSQPVSEHCPPFGCSWRGWYSRSARCLHVQNEFAVFLSGMGLDLDLSFSENECNAFSARLVWFNFWF